MRAVRDRPLARRSERADEHPIIIDERVEALARAAERQEGESRKAREDMLDPQRVRDMIVNATIMTMRQRILHVPQYRQQLVHPWTHLRVVIPASVHQVRETRVGRRRDHRPLFVQHDHLGQVKGIHAFKWFSSSDLKKQSEST